MTRSVCGKRHGTESVGKSAARVRFGDGGETRRFGDGRVTRRQARRQTRRRIGAKRVAKRVSHQLRGRLDVPRGRRNLSAAYHLAIAPRPRPPRPNPPRRPRRNSRPVRVPRPDARRSGTARVVVVLAEGVLVIRGRRSSGSTSPGATRTTAIVPSVSIIARRVSTVVASSTSPRDRSSAGGGRAATRPSRASSARHSSPRVARFASRAGVSAAREAATGTVTVLARGSGGSSLAR